MPNLCIIPARALRDTNLSGIDIRVLCAIGIHTDREGAGCWAYSRTLCEEANVARSSFFESTERLIEGGYIRRRSGKGEGKASAYSIVLDTPQSAVVDGGCPPPRIPPSAGTDTPTINAPINAPSNATPSGGKALSTAGVVWEYNGTVIAEGDYCFDIESLIDRVNKSGGEFRSWVAEMAMAVQGEHGYTAATPQQIGDAVRGYLGNTGEVSFRLFKAYLRASLQPKRKEDDPITVTTSGRQFGKTEQNSRIRSRVAATNLVRKLREMMVRSTVGVSVGHRILPANWAQNFSDAEVGHIRSVGTRKLLSDDDTTASVALSDLANSIQAEWG